MHAVSIIVPCYNAADFIENALKSIAAQTFVDWECIVIDDCSTDQSANIISEFARRDPRFVPILLPCNGGASAARNAGLEAARGKWVTLLDADDIYDPRRLERLVGLIEHSGSDLVFDNQAIADFPDTEQVDVAFHWLSDDAVAFPAERFFTESAIFGRSINPGYMKPMFSRSFLEQHQLRYDPAFRSGQDYLFYANAFARDPGCMATAYCGYIYRRRAGSLSRSGGVHLRNHARLSDEILSRHAPRLSGASKAALRQRQNHFLRAAELHDIRVALAERRLFGAVSRLAAHPEALLAAAAAVRRRLQLKK